MSPPILIGDVRDHVDGPPAFVFHVSQMNAARSPHSELCQPSQGVLGAVGVDGGHAARRIGLPLAVDRLLHVGLDLVVEAHAEVGAAVALDAIGLFPIRAVNLRVVLHLARLDQTGVDLLVFRKVAILNKEAAALPGQRDHALFLEGVERLLSAEPDFAVVGSVTSGAQALAVLQTQHPDIILLDYDLGNEQGLQFLEGLRRDGSRIPILMITAGVGDSQVRRILELPPSGIILKHKPSELLVQAIRAMLRGETWLDSKLVLPLVTQKPRKIIAEDPQLTARERDVLRGVFEGNHNKVIASNLQVSESAVKATLQQLFDKTGVRTRTQLLRLALEKHAADWLGIVRQE